MRQRNGFDTYNAGYAQALYERYLQSPATVDEAWRRFFSSGDAAEHGLIPLEAHANGAGLSPAQLRVAVGAAELVDAYRLRGHMAARLNPLAPAPEPPPTLQPEFYGITAEDLATLPASAIGFQGDALTVSDVLAYYRQIYCGTIGYEYEHLAEPERRHWLREQIESGAHRKPLDAEDKKRLLERLTALEAFEQFLHRSYLGMKRFSGEGNDMLVPMLDVAIERGAAAGAREIILGMAHRGRLNVLAHLLGTPYQRVIAEFEGIHPVGIGNGDVKYHIGGEGTYETRSGRRLDVTLAPNPSHLEFVDPVVEGMVRARQTDLHRPELVRDEDVVLPVLMHGDAAFAGQGVVPETLNMAELDGYRTGGTLHLITNNQIGFTTLPRSGRSTRYASDLAKGFDIPVVHVNADDPEACLAAARLAMDYRARFHGDVVIDMIGYRRYGHNEGDEPAYTQPVLYEAIGEHPTVRKLWADRLVADGVVTADEVEALWEAAHQRLIDAQAEVKKNVQTEEPGRNGGAPAGTETEPEAATAVARDTLVLVDRALHSWPEGFSPHPKLERQLRRRSAAVPDDRPLDWAHAEALALGTLLLDGRPIRMSGQDTQRGTFSQRHLVLHDVHTDARYTPVAGVAGIEVPFEIYNSPLSELAAMGFEYGFSVAAPDALVLWEGQFGDFANGAQVIIDQFISAGQAKWGQEARLALLLPHGSEGQGPEHSSARIERFLQLAAEGNLRIANCSTPAQYFHLLRRQALAAERRPLVVFTPKSLLRHPKATSPVAELTSGRFHPVLDDATADERREAVTRVVLSSGKFYYDLLAAADSPEANGGKAAAKGEKAGAKGEKAGAKGEKAGAKGEKAGAKGEKAGAKGEQGAENGGGAGNVALVRVEQLYPFPRPELEETLAGYPALEEVVWAQEEPQNMGAWPSMEPRIRRLLADAVRLAYVGRPERAAPAEGYANAQAAEQERIVKAVFEPLPTDSAAAPSRPRRARKGSRRK